MKTRLILKAVLLFCFVFTSHLGLADPSKGVRPQNNSWKFSKTNMTDWDVLKKAPYLNLVGVYNNQKLKAVNSSVVLEIKTRISPKKVISHFLKESQLTNKKRMIRKNEFRKINNNLYLSEFLWSPKGRSQVLSVYLITKKSRRFLIVTDWRIGVHKKNAKEIHQLAKNFQVNRVGL